MSKYDDFPLQKYIPSPLKTQKFSARRFDRFGFVAVTVLDLEQRDMDRLDLPRPRVLQPAAGGKNCNLDITLVDFRVDILSILRPYSMDFHCKITSDSKKKP